MIMRSATACIFFALGTSAFAQTFDVASVKPAPPDDGRGMTSVHGGPGSSDPGQVTYRNVSLMNLLGRAYPDSFRIAGPSWLDENRFDLIAKLPPDTTPEQLVPMIRNLLLDRFALKAHHEAREMAAYDLVIAKTGLKMKEAVENPDAASASSSAASGPLKLDQDGFPILAHPGMTTINTISNGLPVARLTATAQPLWRLLGMLRAATQKPVIDKTGLTGKYDFWLEYAPGGAMAVSTTPGQAELGAPSITYAIRSLGLALQDTKTTLDVLVVDHVERVPTEN